MDFAKRYPFLTTILAVCVIAFLVELFFLWKFSSNVSVANKQLQTSMSKAGTAAKLMPAPSQENLDAATKNVEELKAELAEVDHILQDTPMKIENIPTQDLALLEQIGTYKEKMNAAAKAKEILLPNNDYNYGFGMSLYVGKGVTAPPPEKYPAVYKQVKVLEYILSHLIEDAKIPEQKMRIVSVEREDVTSVLQASGSASSTYAAPSEGGGASDFFVIPSTITARVPGAVDTLAFRIKFIAYSESLSILLNDLAKFELPLVVRSVDVEPAPPGDKALTGETVGPRTSSRVSAATVDKLKPVITENFSQFTIVIEYVELPAPPKPAVDPTAAAAAPAGTAGTATSAASGTAKPAATTATGTAK